MSQPPRVRFAPSPTGYLHVGGARTALFNWLFARRLNGSLVLRMEDTDQERNTPQARQSIFEGLRWVGLEPDEGPEQGGDFGPYSQSERTAIYAEETARLKAGNWVYPCFCSRDRLAELREGQKQRKENLGYDGLCRGLSPQEAQERIAKGEAHTWRLRVPEGQTCLNDLIRGEIVVGHKDVEDIILLRADGSVVYNLAVVIDDHHMQITHVLRGEDHLTNTFKQLLLFQAFGWEPPVYAHLPLILGPSGEGKLSKRKHPEAALEHYIEAGYHPEAVVNWLALLGWSYDGEAQIMTREQLIERFRLESVNKAGARLDMAKLAAFSGDAIRKMSDAEVADAIRPRLVSAGLIPTDLDAETGARVDHLARVARERLQRFSDIVSDYAWVFQDFAEYEPKALKNLAKKEGSPDLLEAYAASLPDPLPDPEGLEKLAREFVAEQGVGFGQLVHPVRASVTGKVAGPPLFDCIALVGRSAALERMARGVARGRKQLADRS